jgi:hypothetical protein
LIAVSLSDAVAEVISNDRSPSRMTIWRALRLAIQSYNLPRLATSNGELTNAMIRFSTTAFHISLVVPILVGNQQVQPATDGIKITIDLVDALADCSNITLYLSQSVRHLVGPWFACHCRITAVE